MIHIHIYVTQMRPLRFVNQLGTSSTLPAYHFLLAAAYEPDPHKVNSTLCCEMDPLDYRFITQMSGQPMCDSWNA